MGSTLTTVRQDLAEHLKDDISGVNIYDNPADVIALPAIVIIPGSPWWAIVGHSGELPRMRVNLDLQLIVHRAVPAEALKEIEVLGTGIGASIIGAAQPFAFVSMAEPEQVKIGEVDAVVATFSVYTHLTTEAP